MRYLLILVILLTPAWCLAGVNIDWYEVPTTSNDQFRWDMEQDASNTPGNAATYNGTGSLSSTQSHGGTQSLSTSSYTNNAVFTQTGTINVNSSGYLEGYIYVTADEDEAIIKIDINGSTADYIQLYRENSNDSLVAILRKSATNNYINGSSNTLTTLNTWYACRITWDGATTTLSIDGVDDTTSSTQPTTGDATKITVGDNDGTASTTYYIDDVVLQ